MGATGNDPVVSDAFLSQLTTLGVHWFPDRGSIWVHHSGIEKLLGVERRTAQSKLSGVSRAPASRRFVNLQEFFKTSNGDPV